MAGRVQVTVAAVTSHSTINTWIAFEFENILNYGLKSADFQAIFTLRI